MLNRCITVLLLLLLILSGWSSFTQAKDEVVNPFEDEVLVLTLLKVFPEKNWSPIKPIEYQEYMQLVEKFFNGRMTEPLTKLTEKMTIPSGYISCREALTVAGYFMGYSKETSYAQTKELMVELKKGDFDQITGYDLGYILYTLLYNKRVGQTKNLLEERYIVGKNQQNMSRLMQIVGNTIICEDDVAMQLAPDVQTFLIRQNKISVASFSNVAVGMTGLKLLFNDKQQVSSILLPEKYYPKNIRVLLSEELSSTGGSKSYDFDEIQVTATQPFKITVREEGKDKVILVAETGELIRFANDNGGIKITAGNYTVTIKNRVYLKSYLWHSISFDPLVSTPRHGKVPVYAGTLEIFPSAKFGYLNMVNELSIEQYLQKVVAAQLPASWGKEAVKVQAITARSYAMSQITHARFADKSANVDDSNATQIYNTPIDNPLVNEAIAATEGMVITYNGNIIDAVFFSSSSGFTANSEEVWHNDRTKEFPGTPVPYLRSQNLIYQGAVPVIKDEASVLAFYQNNVYKSYDALAPFYRWKVTLSRTELESTITKGLIERKKADLSAGTDFIQTISGEILDPTNLDFTIGTLKDIKVRLRGEGGNILILDFISSNGVYRVKKEYNIRFVLRPHKDMAGSEHDILMNLNDGTSLKNYSILPSAFAAFDIQRNMQSEIDKVTIYGGGNGHGVGLSQWGVRGMVEKGMTFDQIIKFYYRNVAIEKVY